jgi:hypothetical protein
MLTHHVWTVKDLVQCAFASQFALMILNIPCREKYLQVFPCPF